MHNKTYVERVEEMNRQFVILGKLWLQAMKNDVLWVLRLGRGKK